MKTLIHIHMFLSLILVVMVMTELKRKMAADLMVYNGKKAGVEMLMMTVKYILMVKMVIRMEVKLVMIV